MATTKVINDLIDLNQTGNTTALKGCVGTTAQIPISSSIDVEYLVVAGGGGGGGAFNNSAGGAGGGAGGLSTNTSSFVTSANLSLTVGLGGTGNLAGAPSGTTDGEDSVFDTITAKGGGFGGSCNNSSTNPSNSFSQGQDGGSGGGGQYYNYGGSTPNIAGSGNAGQGFGGGIAYNSNNTDDGAGGGGGASAAGSNGTNTKGGDGGDGLQNNITGTNTYYAGGGGGGQYLYNTASGTYGDGGSGGGGNGGRPNAINGTYGISNTGGGGGGASADSGFAPNGGNGGSGTVIIKYPTANTLTSSAGLLGNYSTGTTSICSYPTTASALYQFEDNTNDTCSGGYNGTEIGSPTYVAGKFGKAISLNGSTQAVTIPSILPTNSAASSSSTCWFKTSYAGANMGTIFSTYDSYGGGGSSTPGWGLWTEGNQNYLRMASYYLFGSVVGTDGTTNVSDGNWHFVAVVFDYSAGTLNCYLDGNSTPEISITGTSATSVDIWTANASIGYQKNPGAASPRYFNGEFDQVRIFPSALTSAQSSALYTETTTPTTGTIGTDTWSQFISGTGTVSFFSDSGPKEGMLRTNTDLTSSGSASAMQFYKASSPSGWVTLTNTVNSSLGNVNFPTTNNGVGLFQLNGNLDNTAGGAASIYAGSSAFSSTSKYGSQSFNFNGSTSIDTGIAVTNSFTVSYWVYRNNTNFQYFYGTCDSNLLNGYLIGSVNPAGNGKLDFVVRNPSYTQTNIARAQGGTIPNNGQWYNITLTHSGSGTVGVTGVNTLYLNGSLVSNTLTGQAYPTGNPIAGTPSNPNNHIFGGAGVYTYERANSLFDQIRIYNTDLTSTQVGQLANET